MKSDLCSWLLLAILCSLPAHGFAISAVFNGDPVDPVSGLPYEMLPGFPLVQAGPDGLYGTADDVVTPAIIGDIDLVVRSGSPAASGALPPPAVQGGRAAVPVGVAGSTAGGGNEIPFTVFLSDGAASAAAPSGQLLAAADMDGIPVVVAAFADLDGDGFIGPTDLDRAGAADNHLEIRELEPVGRAVALFSGGIARGSIAVRAGLPASQGGLTVALAAMALTGPFDPAFFDGGVPSGPAICTALPFFPQRDLARLIRDRVVPASPSSTLQQVIQFAALPAPDAPVSFALPLDGSSPTIDVAVVNSQTAVRATFRESVKPPGLQQSVNDLTLGTRRPANQRRLRLVPVDRWDNPADPPPGFAVDVVAKPPLISVRPPAGKSVALDSSAGVRVVIQVPTGTPGGLSGVVTVEHNGAVVDTLAYRVDTRVDSPRFDLTVPSRKAMTIQAAIDTVTDRNRDGKLVIGLRPGLYRENVVVNRAVELYGADAATTIVQADGSTSALAISASNATVHGLSAVGGTNGFALNGASALLIDSRAWRNLGAGVSVTGSAAEIQRIAALDNGGDGVRIAGANDAVCAASALLGNGGAGANISAAQNARIDDNRIADNAMGGVSLLSVSNSTISDNQSIENLLSGIQLLGSQSSQILGNLCALNDDDGLHIDSDTGTGGQQARQRTTAAGNLISGNTLDTNHGYGLFVRRSPDDDFGTVVGVQAPPGDNDATNNRKGDVFVRTN